MIFLSEERSRAVAACSIRSLDQPLLECLRAGLRLHPLESGAGRSKTMLQNIPRIAHQSVSLLHYVGSHRVQVDVIQERPKTILRLHQNRFVTSSEDMPPEPIAGVDPVRKGILQASHSARKVPFWSLNQQVVMIAHQHVCMQPETCPLTGFLPAPEGTSCDPRRRGSSSFPEDMGCPEVADGRSQQDGSLLRGGREPGGYAKDQRTARKSTEQELIPFFRILSDSFICANWSDRSRSYSRLSVTRLVRSAFSSCHAVARSRTSSLNTSRSLGSMRPKSSISEIKADIRDRLCPSRHCCKIRAFSVIFSCAVQNRSVCVWLAVCKMALISVLQLRMYRSRRSGTIFLNASQSDSVIFFSTWHIVHTRNAKRVRGFGFHVSILSDLLS